MAGSLGPLVQADEGFNHQCVETHASVASSDPAWAEKVCGMAAARDGSFQIGFGFGKYANRNVVDAYAGIARGTEQWTVRASRALSADPDTVNVGPVHYEIIRPLQTIRISLAKNDVQPIAFDIVIAGIAPCIAEQREDRRDQNGYRKATDQIRFHQSGSVSGWFEIDGLRTEIVPDQWIATRDRSWGIRPQVGVPIADMEPEIHSGLTSALAIWNPIIFFRPDGSHYAFHHYHLHFEGKGYLQQKTQGGLEWPDRIGERVIKLLPELIFDPATKRLQNGVFHFTMDDGSERPMPFRKVSELGFYLGAGHYHGGDGRFFGSWRGPLAVDGDHVKNAADPEVIARYTQFRDCLIQVEDPIGGGVGWGNCQTYVYGAWPHYGLNGTEPAF
ncbi:MAG: hypothetical protein RLZZ136_1223 [Pseudomonadota bacterium]|jgi:hypothetical protein